MEELNFSIANQVGAFERGAAKDVISRNIQESFRKFGHEIELVKIRKEFDKNEDSLALRKNLINLTNNKGN